MLILYGDAVCISTDTPCCRPATFLILYLLPAPSLWAAHPSHCSTTNFRRRDRCIVRHRRALLCGLALIGRTDLRVRASVRRVLRSSQAVPELMRSPAFPCLWKMRRDYGERDSAALCGLLMPPTISADVKLGWDDWRESVSGSNRAREREIQ